MACTSFDGSVQMLETFCFEYSGIHVVYMSEGGSVPHKGFTKVALRTFEMPIIERNSDTIEAQRLEKFRVFISKEIFKKLKVYQ